MGKMTREHLEELQEAVGAAQGSAIRYQRYRKARDKYLLTAARLAEVAAHIAAQIGDDEHE